MNWSKYQTDIFDWAEDPEMGKALIINAVAGSGKTTVGVEMFNRIDGYAFNPNFVAFNKHIQAELQRRLPQGAKSQTYHALGFASIRRNAPGRVQVDADKLEKILRNNILAKERFFLIPSIKRLVQAAKNSMAEPSVEFYRDAAFIYDVELFRDSNPDLEWDIYDAATELFNQSNRTDFIDFDDMIWLPVYNDMSFEKYDFLFVDELQDTNPAQLECAVRSLSKDGRFVGCGDPWQGIYTFRGADSDSMDRVGERMGALKLPLSISYRCPKSIGQLINQKFPEISFETHETAIEGSIETVSGGKAEKMYNAGTDLILCRVNAPLIPAAMSLIRRGIKATVKGSDIGKELVRRIKKMGAYDVSDLNKKLADYHAKETQRLLEREKTQLLRVLDDKIETIYAIIGSSGSETVGGVMEVCDRLFADDAPGVAFSTVHKAKGLESERVFILRSDLIPHPAAKQAWEKEEERHVEYVAISRVKGNKNNPDSGKLIYVQ